MQEEEDRQIAAGLVADEEFPRSLYEGDTFSGQYWPGERGRHLPTPTREVSRHSRPIREATRNQGRRDRYDHDRPTNDVTQEMLDYQLARFGESPPNPNCLRSLQREERAPTPGELFSAMMPMAPYSHPHSRGGGHTRFTVPRRSYGTEEIGLSYEACYHPLFANRKGIIEFARCQGRVGQEILRPTLHI
jgi:hypothetical protein